MYTKIPIREVHFSVKYTQSSAMEKSTPPPKWESSPIFSHMRNNQWQNGRLTDSRSENNISFGIGILC